ncbi:MAG: DUF456 domain-containing protein [Patescibacteria group bacterium]
MELEIVIAILMFFGILFTALPTVPGMIYMLILAVVYGLVDHFQTFSPWFFALFVGLVAAAILTDYMSGIIGAKFGGASKKSLLAGLVGMIIGFFLFPPFGLFLGLFIAIFAAEMLQFMDQKKAWKAASYSAVATLVGMGANILLAIAFFVSFLILVF